MKYFLFFLCIFTEALVLTGQQRVSNCDFFIENPPGTSGSVVKIIAQDLAKKADNKQLIKATTNKLDYNQSMLDLQKMMTGYQDQQNINSYVNIGVDISVEVAKLYLGKIIIPSRVPFINETLEYVLDKGGALVSEKVENSLQDFAEGNLKKGLNDYRNKHSLSSLSKLPPEEILNKLNNEGYLPALSIGDGLDANGKIVLQEFMISSLRDVSILSLETLAKQGKKIDLAQQDIKEFKVLASKLWDKTVAMNESLKKIDKYSKNINSNLNNLNKFITETYLKDREAAKQDMEFMKLFMYGKMTPEEKLFSLRSGFKPSGIDSARESIKLQLQVAKNDAIKEMSNYLNSAHEIYNIANNIGIKGKTMVKINKGLEIGQHVLNGVIAYNSGPAGWLSAASSFSNILGVGGQSGGSKMHEQIIGMLQNVLQNQAVMMEQLNMIQKSQNQIMENQIKTYELLLTISKQIDLFEQKTMSKLDRVEYDILMNTKIISGQIFSDYNKCLNIYSSDPLNLNINEYDKIMDFETYDAVFNKWTQGNACNKCLNWFIDKMTLNSSRQNDIFIIPESILVLSDQEALENYNFRLSNWRNQISFLDKVIQRFDLSPKQTFYSLLNPMQKVNFFDPLYIDNISNFKPLNRNKNDISMNAVRDLYSWTIMSDVIKKFYFFLPMLELRSKDEQRLLKPEELLLNKNNQLRADVKSYVENTCTSLDVFIAQKAILSGVTFIPYYYTIITSSEEKYLELKVELINVLANNPILAENFTLYCMSKHFIQNSKSSHYPFALATEGDSWYFKDFLNDKLLSFLEPNNSKEIQSNWVFHFKSNSGTQLKVPLPSFERLQEGLISFETEYYEAIALREKILDYLGSHDFFSNKKAFNITLPLKAMLHEFSQNKTN